MSAATKKINQSGSLCPPQDHAQDSKTVASNYHHKWWQLVNFAVKRSLCRGSEGERMSCSEWLFFFFFFLTEPLVQAGDSFVMHQGWTKIQAGPELLTPCVEPSWASVSKDTRWQEGKSLVHTVPKRHASLQRHGPRHLTLCPRGGCFCHTVWPK